MEFHFKLHLITIDMAHSSEVVETTRTQLDMTLLTSTSWLWCTCQYATLLNDGCVLECTLYSSLHSLVLWGLRWPWFSQDGSMHVFLSLITWCGSFVCSTASTSSSMFSFFIPFVVALCSINVPIPAITHDEMTSNPKPPSLAWCIFLMFWVTRREENSLRHRRAQLVLEWGTPRGKPALQGKTMQRSMGGIIVEWNSPASSTWWDLEGGNST